MKLKVCGMKENTAEVAAIRPDYLGFIFWDKSSRFFDGDIPKLTQPIKKIGVFVNESVDGILEKTERYDLQGVQLHGNEGPKYCKKLREKFDVSLNLEIIKVFPITDNFDFSILRPYEEVCDYFLFDTKGKLPGGNGYTFDWKVLENYPLTKPYFLSGGIGPEEVESIKEFAKRPKSYYCHGIDINSRFEKRPGLKEVKKLKNFKETLNSYNLL